MDNPATESSSNTPLEPNEAASLFAAVLTEDEQPKEQEAQASEPEPQQAEQEPVEQEAEASAEDDPLVTVKIDGKEVEVPLSELKNGYQRQADYTRKTMEVSEQRKAAEAQLQQARAEREAYAANLQKMQVQLEGALQEQQKTNWEELLQSDPVEYLRQQHLAQARQAQLQQVYQEQQKVLAQQQAEQQHALARHLNEQQQELLAKLPEWKDDAKAKAEKVAIREYLMSQGYDEQSVNNVADARAVVMARKAMLYDQMISKASAAAKKVSTLPTKVERPGSGEKGIDRRTAAYLKLNKTGRVDDAAAVFASLL